VIRLSPAMTWSRRDAEVFVHGETQILLVSDCPPDVDAMMRLLVRGCDSTAFAGLDIETSCVTGILEILREANCLIDVSSDRWAATALERQADYFAALGADPDEVHANLGTATVALLGLGGIGSVTLAHLVSAGLQRFTLVDGDVVQIHNLNRQFLYRPSDVGRRKVDAVADWVRERHPTAMIRSVPRMITEQSELTSLLGEHTALLVQAADSPSDIAVLAAQACLATGTPLISADCGLRTASWGPLVETADLQTHTLALLERRGRAPVPPAAQAMSASFGPTNAIVAAYLAKEILSWFAGLPVASRGVKVVVDLDQFRRLQ
jgi:molybdopterin/thiamine biosynthesis adenylyltransferase